MTQQSSHAVDVRQQVADRDQRQRRDRAVEREAQDERGDQAEDEPGDRRRAAEAVVHRPGGEHREEDRVADAEVPAVPVSPHAGRSKLSASALSGSLSSSRDVGPLATDQTSIAATNTGTAIATAGVLSQCANSSPTAAASIASATFAPAPTPAAFSAPGEQARPEHDEQRADRPCPRAGSSDSVVAATISRPIPPATSTVCVAGGQRRQRRAPRGSTRARRAGRRARRAPGRVGGGGGVSTGAGRRTTRRAP